jgi:ectoine hydroxylase-related dioxygenase (phytanoyl-CoA dioxygenase family)
VNLQPLHISNPILNDPEALRSQMRERGYLFFRGLVNRDRVLEARRDVLKILEKHGVLDKSGDLMEGQMQNGSTPTRRDLIRFHREINPLESFNALAHSDEMLGMLKRLIGGRVQVHTRKICRIKYPHDEYDIVCPHQDYFYIRGAEDTYSAWLPLGDIDLSVGGLAVAPGSHRFGFLDHRKPEDSRFSGVSPEDADRVWHRSDYAPGDVIIFHSLTLHRGLPNISNRVRLSVDYRYQREGTDIEASHLQPHFAGMSE